MEFLFLLHSILVLKFFTLGASHKRIVPVATTGRCDGTGKGGKVVSVRAMKATGGVEVQLYSLSTSSLVEAYGQLYAPGRSIFPGKDTPLPPE